MGIGVLERKVILSILGVIALSLGAITIWLTELLWQVGWDGNEWLWSSQYAVFGINLLAVAAYLLPVRLLLQTRWVTLLLVGLELYFVAIIAFFLTKSILYSLFLPITVFELSIPTLYLMLGALALTSAGSCYYLTRNYLYPVKTPFIPIMLGAQLLAAALSLLAAYLYFHISQPVDLLMQAVQAGLPFFFFTLLIGLFSLFSIRKLKKEWAEEREDQTEILDDMEFPGKKPPATQQE